MKNLAQTEFNPLMLYLAFVFFAASFWGGSFLFLGKLPEIWRDWTQLFTHPGDLVRVSPIYLGFLTFLPVLLLMPLIFFPRKSPEVGRVGIFLFKLLVCFGFILAPLSLFLTLTSGFVVSAILEPRQYVECQDDPKRASRGYSEIIYARNPELCPYGLAR